MKKKIVSNAKKLFTQHKRAVKVFVRSVLFVIGFFVTLIFFQRPVPNEQFALCEQAVHYVAPMEFPDSLTSATLRIDVTADFSVKVFYSKDTIIVSPVKNSFYRTYSVVAEFKNGALVLERKSGIVQAVFISILGGVLLLVIGLFPEKIYLPVK